MTQTDLSTSTVGYEGIQSLIKSGYDGLKAAEGFRSRAAQRGMIGTLAKAFHAASDDHRPMVVIEAGTGTGKTFGYCLPLIPIAQLHQKTLIIATGTVALQEQLVLHDLPELRQRSGLSFTFALAKGRRRYLCPLRLLSAASNGQSMLFEMGSDIGDYAKKLADEFDNGWDGDLDRLPYPLPESVQQSFTTDAAGCANKRCQHFDICPYMKGKANLMASDVIVTNHALLIADLKLGGGAVLPATASCFHVIDEGHRLPAEVLSHTASAHLLHGAQSWLDTLIKVAQGMGSIGDQDYQKYSDHWSNQLVTHAQTLKNQLQLLYASLSHNTHFHPSDANAPQRFRRQDDPHLTRFEHGIIPEWLTEAGKGILATTEILIDAISKAFDLTNDAHARDPQDALMKQNADFGFLRDRLSNVLLTWTLLLEQRSENPNAKWIEYRQKGDTIDFMVSASPIEASSFLQSHLWKTSAGVAITSATLTALGAFDYYFQQCGIHAEKTIYQQFLSPFDFNSKATLNIPHLVDPTSPLHTKSIIEWILCKVDANEGTLMLFTSNKQMKEVYAGIEHHFNIQMQGQAAKHQLIKDHKLALDAGKGSILMGLDSFGEGLNLPGKYCTHVVIAKLPFPVPTSPVEQAQSEYLERTGKNAFREISLPLTSAKLTQWVGRLLRTEDDEGRISILDSRLNTKSYGRQMVAALPPFRILNEP